ncbi:baseplate complex protein [Rodentibacter pneumotropicus]|uniref:baseplate complex protein n=1 Tax=Rodentibacter pneumotropicus TaxID=758 RepID=UPI000365F83F|nr:hypothetical protein [Rodentibacter pneumotropicus]OOF61400.1 hypothetical protein BKL50_08370 [Rodentibacter pneumotropicus]OOF64063.1 hypothetical protein BH925_07305 [Rodentibacter pneumotropicus]THA14748.1 hypothetical protein D3M83_10870 [Rodentibacter pneumotropicus]
MTLQAIKGSSPQPIKRNPSVQLALNGTPIYLHNILMTVSVKREEKDMSGQKSSTKKSDKGIKAKELSVTGFIPYNRKEWLTQLFNLAESEDGKGEQSKYRVSCTVAEAVNMREVQFSSEVSATEQNGQLGWAVSFTLREVNSVAEKKDQRKKKPKAKVQGEKAPVAQSANKSTNKSAVENPENELIGGSETDMSASGRLNQGDLLGAIKAGAKGDWSNHGV